MLNISLLGCGGTMPLPNRYLTALLASFNGRMILIDCGEGTQVSMKILGSGFKHIEAICFTHFHADHIVGLPGLLLTIANSGRTEELTIIGPVGLEEVILGLRVISPNLPYDIKLIELDMENICEINQFGFIIKSIPVDHAVPCVSYSIEVKRSRIFDRQKAEEQGIPVMYWNRLKNGEVIVYENKKLTPDMVLGDERKGLKVCYCTDTRPVGALADFAYDADLFICEGMYGDDEYLPKAINNKHMLFSEAAKLAKEGNVKELWLTHFSPSIVQPEEFLKNASNIFSNTKIGEDRMKLELFFSK
jgi:ribonuclease Z